MKAATKKPGGLNVDFKRLADDFKGLNPNDPGVWPLAPQVTLLVVLLAVTIGLFWYFDWQGQWQVLGQRDQEELRLRDDWQKKKEKAINLDEYRKQLVEIDREFGALLKQLPNKAEMDALLADINQAGLGRGLKFELFRPGNDSVKDFYAEMPIAIRVVGGYHDLGAFASDVAKMPRIVTLNNISISTDKGSQLKLDATAMTYRYLDEQELASSKKSAKSRRRGR